MYFFQSNNEKNIKTIIYITLKFEKYQTIKFGRNCKKHLFWHTRLLNSYLV